MFRIAAASLVILGFTGVPVHAAEDEGGSQAGTPKLTITLPAVAVSQKRPVLLPVLYLGLAGLHAFDVYSTRQGLSQGARELNPVMAGNDTTSMVVVKTVSTAMTIVMAERLWHRNKTAAILTMVAANGVMVFVAANNARVLHQTR